MAEITASLIKTLRDKTNAGMMDCKAALTEAAGDLEEAETILRKKGIASADKKASRATSEGVIAALIDSDARLGVLVEINCETDFVAKNENFRAFVDDVLQHIAESAPAADVDALLAQPYIKDSSLTLAEALKAKIAEMGENMALPRFARYQLGDAGGAEGVIASYIHMQGKVGVLLELTCGKAETAKSGTFKEVAKDLTLHIAAAHPVCVSRDEIPAGLVAKEREIYAEQVKGKPDNIIEKIVDGKLEKYYSTVALLEQGFIKDTDKTVDDLVKATAKTLGDEITVRRFTRFAVGDS